MSEYDPYEERDRLREEVAELRAVVDAQKQLEAETKNLDTATELSWCGVCNYNPRCPQCMVRAGAIRDYREYLAKVRQAARLDKIEADAQSERAEAGQEVQDGTE